MNTFMRHLLFVLLSLGIHACWLATGTTGGPTTPEDVAAGSDRDQKLLEAAVTFTQCMFGAAEPAINAEVQKLPPDAQLLAQTAYAALERAVQTAAAQGADGLDAQEREEAAKTLANLAHLSDVLNTLLHEGDARASSPAAAP